jgi:hypothetical protein
MQQPKEYRVEYIVEEDVPYRNADPNAKGTHAGDGIFHEGRVVWLAKTLGEMKQARCQPMLTVRAWFW